MSRTWQPRNKSTARALIFTRLLPTLQRASRDCGYALGIHGSMQTDFDLIACPWVENAEPAEVLAEALRASIGGFIVPEDAKPHGRRAWLIYFEGPELGPYLDVSVMPTATKAEASE